jgi:Flp pilus assembly protein CpaB
MLLGGSLMCAGFVFVGGTIWYGQRRQEKMMTKAVYAPPVTVPAPQPAFVVPDGKRAVSVRVTMDGAVAGFILPGSRVDVINTVPDAEDARKALSKTIIQDVMVLASNMQGAQSIVTLAVTAEQADTLDDAKERGSISVALRRPGE